MMCFIKVDVATSFGSATPRRAPKRMLYGSAAFGSATRRRAPKMILHGCLAQRACVSHGCLEQRLRSPQPQSLQAAVIHVHVSNMYVYFGSDNAPRLPLILWTQSTFWPDAPGCYEHPRQCFVCKHNIAMALPASSFRLSGTCASMAWRGVRSKTIVPLKLLWCVG